jgi:carboxynorspermidine decarboxylase
LDIGLRLNPEIGHSTYTLSHPACRYSRLGVTASQIPADIEPRITGAMTHVNCENHDIDSFERQLAVIGDRFPSLLAKCSWFSLGGGIAFTDSSYPLERFCAVLRRFAERHELQLYLEPGEAAVTNSTSLVVTVLDVVHNEVPTLIVDSGVETHLLDVLTYAYTPELCGATALPRESQTLEHEPGHVYRVCGRTCLAGDLFGNYRFDRAIDVGEQLQFTNVGSYSMVKKNHFNGIEMPAIYHRTIGGEIRKVHAPSYEDFRDALS